MIRMTHHAKAVIGCLAAALAMAGGASLSAQATARAQGDLETEVSEEAPSAGEQKLARLLEGRVAGAPVRCINTRPSQPMRTIDGVAYVYGSGNTIYVQRTRRPDEIRDSNILISDRVTGSQMCRTDLLRAVDQFSGFFMGPVFFEDFVPYTRVRTAGISTAG